MENLKGVLRGLVQADWTPPTHTPTCLPLNVGHPSEVCWIMSDNLLIMTKLYQNPENFRSVFCSPRAAELCTQTSILLLHADPTGIWSRPYSDLGLTYRPCRTDATMI